MNNHARQFSRISALALLLLIAGWGVSQADEESVAGVYSLEALNGESLPASSWTETPDGERCKQVILRGVLLLDSEGRSAAFLTERVFCPSEADQGNEGRIRSVIFAGSYRVSGNQITVEDDFGTDQAVVEGDVLIYETGGDGRPVDKFVFRKE